MQKLWIALAISLVTSTAYAEDNTQVIHTRYGDIVTTGGLIESRLAQLSFNGSAVFKSEDAFFFSILKVLHVKDSDVAVLAINSGGTACPAIYRVLRFQPTGKAQLSKEFGTCSDVPRITQRGEEVLVSMPQFNGPGRAKALWEYKAGKLKVIKAPR